MPNDDRASPRESTLRAEAVNCDAGESPPLVFLDIDAQLRDRAAQDRAPGATVAVEDALERAMAIARSGDPFMRRFLARRAHSIVGAGTGSAHDPATLAAKIPWLLQPWSHAGREPAVAPDPVDPSPPSAD